MSDEKKEQDVGRALPPDEESQEEKVARVLESARQTVKPIVKREMEGEVVTPELFGLRLKG
jgi:hypothetical protein